MRVADAAAAGVGLFAFDSETELKKLAQNAPGSRVFCRLLIECRGGANPNHGASADARRQRIGATHREPPLEAARRFVAALEGTSTA